MGLITRFAPSPTGPLHLGHAASALVGFERARATGGAFHLRIEDLDPERCKPQWEAAIFDDLRWLGIRWSAPVLRQSDRRALYAQALARLDGMGLIYPCRCNRADIRAALGAPQEGAPLLGPDGLVYPGTCRARRDRGPDDALRLDMARALAVAGADVHWVETGPLTPGLHRPEPQAMIEGIGDIVLARRGWGASYHLAVVVDDAAQGITEVTRGADLAEATAIHVLLQRLLGLPVLRYHHHDLVRDAAGKRLAKRDDALALSTLRAQGCSVAEIRQRIAPVLEKSGLSAAIFTK